MKKSLVPVQPIIFSGKVLVHLLNIFPESTNEIPHFLLTKWPIQNGEKQIQLNQVRPLIGANDDELITESLRESIPSNTICMATNKATFDFLKRLGIHSTIMQAGATLANTDQLVDNWCAMIAEEIRPKNSERSELLNQTKLNFAAVAFFENTANMSDEEVFWELLRRMLSVDIDTVSVLEPLNINK